MGVFYRKYQEHGGKLVFQTSQLQSNHDILDELYTIASSHDYVRDMQIYEKLSSLLILLTEEAGGRASDRAGYLSRLFKEVEGVSPTFFRKGWGGKLICLDYKEVIHYF